MAVNSLPNLELHFAKETIEMREARQVLYLIIHTEEGRACRKGESINLHKYYVLRYLYLFVDAAKGIVYTTSLWLLLQGGTKPIKVYVELSFLN